MAGLIISRKENDQNASLRISRCLKRSPRWEDRRLPFRACGFLRIVHLLSGEVPSSEATCRNGNGGPHESHRQESVPEDLMSFGENAKRVLKTIKLRAALGV